VGGRDTDPEALDEVAVGLAFAQVRRSISPRTADAIASLGCGGGSKCFGKVRALVDTDMADT
jgi:hypothetical protein